jgi:hypothetical protein
VIRPAVPVDKYQTVAFDNSRYSVPRALAFRLVTVKGYVDRVVVVADGQVVADHARSLEKSRMVLNPLHYLAALGRKPGALDHAPVFRDWELPACFAELRAALEESHGQQGGSHRFVRVMQLMNDHPMTRVGQAVVACLREHLVSAESVIQRTRTLAATEAAACARPTTTGDTPVIPQVQVPLPDLSRFDLLLGGPAIDGSVTVFFT